MKFIKYLVLAIGFALLSGAATAATEEQKNPVQSTTDGAITVIPAMKQAGIYAVYAGSEDLTKILREGLVSKGYKLENDESKAKIKLVVNVEYFGDPLKRPKFGLAEKSPDSNLNLGHLITGVLFGVVGNDSPARRYFKGGWSGTVASNYWAMVISSSYPVDLLKPTSEPVDALITHMNVAEGSTVQSAQILSESYAENLPKEAMFVDNMKTVLWYME